MRWIVFAAAVVLILAITFGVREAGNSPITPL